jgi:hypothetical protein
MIEDPDDLARAAFKEVVAWVLRAEAGSEGSSSQCAAALIQFFDIAAQKGLTRGDIYKIARQEFSPNPENDNLDWELREAITLALRYSAEQRFHDSASRARASKSRHSLIMCLRKANRQVR